MSCGWLPFSSAPLMDARGHKHIAGCQYAAIYLQYQMSRLESFWEKESALEPGSYESLFSKQRLWCNFEKSNALKRKCYDSERRYF